MEDKEIIEILNDMKGVFGERGHSQYSLYAIDRAIAAIEKQIPKQVQYLDKNEGYFECGTCKGAIYNTSDDLEDHIYCLLCGQKVDWR